MAQVNYAYHVRRRAEPRSDRAGQAVRMETELGGGEIYYTFDGTNPDRYTAKYAGQPVPVPGDAYLVKAIAWRNGRPSGRILTLSLK